MHMYMDNLACKCIAIHFYVHLYGYIFMYMCMNILVCTCISRFPKRQQQLWDTKDGKKMTTILVTLKISTPKQTIMQTV